MSTPALRQRNGPAQPYRRPSRGRATYPRQARTPFNVTGHPALAMSGLSSSGLPLSVQFVSWQPCTQFLYSIKKEGDSRIFQAQDRAIDDFTFK